MTRRQFGGLMAGALAAPPPKWNLLVITNDQHRADCVGAYGNKVVQTPNTDRLAREGVLFEKHFVQCPQCVPSRSVMHTGRYPHVNRTPTNLYRLPDTEETLATILGRNGYCTATAGELPFAPTSFLGGFQTAISNREHDELIGSKGWKNEAAKAPFQAQPAPWPEEFDETPYFGAKAVEYIKQNRERPFYLHVNFRRPHHPFDPPAPFDRMYAGASFPASHKRPGEMANKPPQQAKAIENTAGCDLRGMTDRDLQKIKSFYYGMISLNDKYIGRILDAVDDHTIVVFNADHGEMLGDHGLLFKGGYFYDGVVQTPLIIRAPGKLPAGKRIPGIVETADLMPSLLDLLGIPIPERVQGRSLLPTIEGAEKRPRVAHSEFPTTKMIRTADWKLVHYAKAPYGELYNLKEDPQELYNLYSDAGYARQLAEMKSMLADWLIESQDPLLKPITA